MYHFVNIRVTVFMRTVKERLSYLNPNLRVLTLTQIFGMFCRRMVFPYASLFILAVGGTASQIGIINGLQPLAGLLMFPVSGYLTDRTGRVKLIALAFLLSGLTLLLYIFAPSWEWIALGALLQGFMVFQFPPTSAILVDSMEPQNRGLGIATMNTLATGFSIFSPYVAALIIEFYGDNFGIRILYISLAMSNFIGALLVFKYLKETMDMDSTNKRLSIISILRESYRGIPDLVSKLPRSVKAMGLLLAMGLIANGVASPFWVVYITEELGISKIGWGIILLIETVLVTLLTVPFGVFADRYSKSKILFIAILLSLLSMPTIVLARNFVQVLFIRLVIGVSRALLMPTGTALMADFVPREHRGKVMAAIGSGGYLLGAAGGGTGGPGVGYLFTLPLMASSVIGGILYSINPIYVWLVVLGTIIIQILSLTLFIRDPDEAEH
jgi:MFS family permease